MCCAKTWVTLWTACSGRLRILLFIDWIFLTSSAIVAALRATHIPGPACRVTKEQCPVTLVGATPLDSTHVKIVLQRCSPHSYNFKTLLNWSCAPSLLHYQVKFHVPTFRAECKKPSSQSWYHLMGLHHATDSLTDLVMTAATPFPWARAVLEHDGLKSPRKRQKWWGEPSNSSNKCAAQPALKRITGRVARPHIFVLTTTQRKPRLCAQMHALIFIYRYVHILIVQCLHHACRSGGGRLPTCPTECEAFLENLITITCLKGLEQTCIKKKCKAISQCTLQHLNAVQL